MQIFFKMATYFQVATTAPVPLNFDGLPYPCVGGTPDFFHQNDCKGCKRDYLDARGSLCLAFWCNRRQTVSGNHPPPLRKTRVKDSGRCFNLVFLTVSHRLHQNAKQGGPGHLSNLFYILSGHLDENIRGYPFTRTGVG